MQREFEYKQTEVGVIPNDWHVEQLQNIAKLINGRAYSLSEWESAGTPVIRLQNLTGGDEYYYSNMQLPDKHYCHNGDLLYMWSATFGPRIWHGEKAIYHYHIWKVECNPTLLDKMFMYYQLDALTQDLTRKSTNGGTMLHVTKEIMEHRPIPLPLLSEQRAIAAALSDVDALLNSLDALIAKKRLIKQGAMQELLMGKKRLPGFSGQWEVKKVWQFGEVVTGGTPSTTIKEYWNGDIPWVTPTDISTKKDIASTERQITSHGLSAVRKLPANSVLVTCIASIGKNAILRKDGATNQQINAIIPNKDHFVDFLYYLFEYNKQYLLGNAGTTATSIISKKDFSELVFRVPNLPEQTAIAEILSDMDAEISALEQKHEKTRLLKQGMMQELLTGRIRLL